VRSGVRVGVRIVSCCLALQTGCLKEGLQVLLLLYLLLEALLQEPAMTREGA
jgi:hypothetical protein